MVTNPHRVTTFPVNARTYSLSSQSHHDRCPITRRTAVVRACRRSVARARIPAMGRVVLAPIGTQLAAITRRGARAWKCVG